MRSPVRRLAILLTGASLGAVGWGAVLPFLYADVSDARHLGAAAAALTFSAFALGALVAAPLAGRWADGRRPMAVATLARLAMVGAILGLMFADVAWAVELAAFGYGAALAVLQPSVSVLVLAITPPARRRDAFAWQFIGQNLGLALGGVVGGYLVDLHSATGSRPAYAFAAVCSVLSAAVVAAAASRAAVSAQAPSVGTAVETVSSRAVLRAPGVGWLLAVTGLLTLAFYAQYDSGLPAYALTVLHVPTSTLGTAVAVNAVLVALMTAPMVRATRRVSPATLLAACGGTWIVVWVLLAAPMLHLAPGSATLVGAFALFSLGETVLAPVLQPLAATLAPAGAAGRTFAAVGAAQTLATAIGPALSGVLLALHAPAALLAMQVVVCAAAVLGSRQLHRALAARGRSRVAPVREPVAQTR